MTRTVLIGALSFISFVVGCTEPGGQRDLNAGALSTASGLAEYLRQQPAVRGVEQWPNEYAAGLIISTPHYRIYTTLSDPLILCRVPGFMESAYQAYQSQLPQPIDTHTEFVTYLFADRGQWEDFTKVFAGANAGTYLQIRKGAYYLNGACVAYNIGRTRTFSALGHEGWHQFNTKHFVYRLPSWLDEGVACLFEVSRYERGKYEFVPEANIARLQTLKKTIERNQMMPVADLIKLNPGQLVADTESVKSFYAQSYALVRFLREDEYGKRLRRYHNLLLGGLRGTWPLDEELKTIAADRNIPLTVAYNRTLSPALFAFYIDDDFSLIDTQYTAFCQRNVYHIRPGQ